MRVAGYIVLAMILQLALLAVDSSQCAFSKELKHKAGTSQGSIRVGNRTRTLRYHVPKHIETTPALVIVLHGGLGSAISGEWDSRMSEQSEKQHFLVAYPNGYLRTWNAYGCCGPAKRKHIDDIAFLRMIIEKFEREFAVDPTRVFVAGVSNGGMMAYRAGLELSDKVAAVGSLEGCMYKTQRVLDIPISVIAINGKKDRIIRYDGGVGQQFGYKINSQSVADTIKFWVEHNHCTPVPSTSESGNITKYVYSGGDDSCEVCLYSIKNGGHVWPGGRRCTLLGDRPNDEFIATQAIIDFFLSHPKKSQQQQQQQ